MKQMNQSEIEQMKQDARTYIIPHFADNEELAKEVKIFTRGEGCYLYDAEGKRYIDTFASLLTTICGHRRKEVDEAIVDQLKDLEFFPNYVDTFTAPLIRLGKKLAQIMPGELSVSFFVNSGSEANETAIKMARQYHWERGEKTRYKVLFRRDSYHGTTLATCSATGIPWFREYFEPLLSPGFIPTVAGRYMAGEEESLDPSEDPLCLKLLLEQIQWEGPDTIAALIMDPLPGSNSGYPAPPKGYIKRIREICDANSILLIFDEVQTGFGKTGKMFACEHWGVTPDIMTIGKGFSGGYIPLAAAVTTEGVAGVFREPGHEFRSGSTYGGHTLACAATLANIQVIEDQHLVQNAAEMGEYLVGRLADLREKFAIVGRVSGMGLLQALFLEGDGGLGGFIREYCYQNGVILRNNGNILVFAPALIITRSQIDEILGVLEQALQAATERFPR